MSEQENKDEIKKMGNQEEQEKRREKEMISFNQWGREFARDTNCNPDSINSGLNSVYNDFLSKQRLDKEAIQNTIDTLDGEVEDLQKDNENLKASHKNLEIANEKCNEDIEVKKEEIVELENEILDITDGKGAEPDKTMYNLYLTFTILAYIGVVLSYMVTLGSALVGLNEDDVYINGDIFSALLDSGLGIIVLTVFVAAILPPVGGYFYQKLKKEKNNTGALGILAVVLLVDIIIGYFLAKQIYTNSVTKAAKEGSELLVPWDSMGLSDKLTHLLSDPNFYIVLILNFAMYMIFGLLLKHCLDEYDKLNPGSMVAQLKNKIERIKEKIEDLKNNITENNKNIEAVKAQIEKNNITINKKLKDIEDYKNGKIPINVSYLKDLISQFLRGYQSYVDLMVSKRTSGQSTEDQEKAKIIVKQVIENAEKWFKNKQENGWTNDDIALTNNNFFGI